MESPSGAGHRDRGWSIGSDLSVGSSTDRSSRASFWSRNSIHTTSYSPGTSPSTVYSASFPVSCSPGSLAVSGPETATGVTTPQSRRRSIGAVLTYETPSLPTHQEAPIEDGSAIAPVASEEPALEIAERSDANRDDEYDGNHIEPTLNDDLQMDDLEPPRASTSGSTLPKRLLLKTRDRAASLSRISLQRPKLERREDTHAPTSGDRRPTTPTLSLIKGSGKTKERFKKLQGRLLRSAPVTPNGLTPTPSTDRLNEQRTLRSVRSTLYLQGLLPNGGPIHSDFNVLNTSSYFPAQPYATPPLFSPGGSCYQPALETPSLEPLSAEDIVPEEPSEVFHDAQTGNHFDDLLPREIRLRIFKALIHSCIEEHRAERASRAWTASRARSERWVGEARGLREIVKLSGVSREWRELALDGQLWKSIEIGRKLGNDTFQPSGLVRLVTHANAFIRKLDLRGYRVLQSEDLDAITEALTAHSGETSLIHLDLSDCRAISTKSLHNLLSHSPSIEILRLKSLPAVISSTCDTVIRANIRDLWLLDVSLCHNLLAVTILEIGQPGLRHLYASRLSSMDTPTVSAIASRFPLLQTLDIGYCRNVGDEAFKRWRHYLGDEGTLPLRHLRLSGCIRLTDGTCSQLVGRLPNLETLEMASIGPNLRDGGVVKLLESLPRLRRIDLEDAINLTDKVVTALIPVKVSRRHQYTYHHRMPATAPICPLEHVNLTNVPELSEAALIRLIKSNPNLKGLETSNSFAISDTFVKAFMQHVRRQKIVGGQLDIVDCRSVSRTVFKEASPTIRPRRGIRDYPNRHFEYIDTSQVGKYYLGECDDRRTVVHSYWTWQVLDEAEASARQARTSKLAIEGGATRSPGTLSPSLLRTARRASFPWRAGGTTPNNDTVPAGGSSCVIM